MKYEIIESVDGWLVCHDGEELARHERQDEALNDVAERLRAAPSDAPASLSMRYARRTA